MSDLKKENARLREALDRISRPVWWIQEDAKLEGSKVNGHMAIALASDPHYLRGIAEKALSKEAELDDFFMSHAEIEEICKEHDEVEKRITIEDGCVVMYWNQAKEGYWVDLKRVRNWPELVDWMLHLSEKGWMDAHKLHLFAETTMRAKGWDRPNA
jgi:hypothetical protein